VATGIIRTMKILTHPSCDKFVDQLFLLLKARISFRRPEKSNNPSCRRLDERPNEPEIFPSASEPSPYALHAQASLHRAW